MIFEVGDLVSATISNKKVIGTLASFIESDDNILYGIIISGARQEMVRLMDIFPVKKQNTLRLIKKYISSTPV